ncbi:MAG TPA: response regulator transcription factor [Gemmatimonadaceae bacterium]|jgi:two-component system alkaline phosphatase synthesis response regulator PhoP
MKDPTAHLLLVEDEPNLARGIRENLEAEGYAVEVVMDGRVALDRVLAREYGLVILDVMLPSIDGFAVCEAMRREGRDTPVLFLTARGGPDDRIRGLAVGGDDYLPKPFQLRELLLRVAAILRRRMRYDAITAREPVVRFGGNEFDFRSFRGRSHDGNEQFLTQKEAMILKVLVEREGQVVWRDDILDLVWGEDVLPSTRTIDNFIVRLRKRFEPDPEQPRHFHTVRGIGYRFTKQPTEGA